MTSVPKNPEHRDGLDFCQELHLRISRTLLSGAHGGDAHYFRTTLAKAGRIRLSDYFFYCHKLAVYGEGEDFSYDSYREKYFPTQHQVLENNSAILEIKFYDQEKEYLLFRPCDVNEYSVLGDYLKANINLIFSSQDMLLVQLQDRHIAIANPVTSSSIQELLSTL